MTKAYYKKIASVGVMSAVSAVLMILEFPVGIIPEFIKLDLSDIPALLISFSQGPLCAAIVCLIKCVIHLSATTTAGAGEAANLIYAISLTVPAGLFYRYVSHTKKGALIGCAIGTVVMALVSLPINYFVIFPFFSVLYGMDIEIIVGAFKALYPFADTLFKAVALIMVPFNILKGCVVTIVTMLVYKHLSPLLK